jgi:hypothetical protein
MIEDQEQPEVEQRPGSLAARARTLRQQRLANQTITIEAPGLLAGILAIEYRATSYAESKRIATRHERQQDLAVRDLYMAADHLLLASVNAFEINERGETQRELGFGWGISLAQALDVKLSEAATARQALMAIVEDYASDVQLVTHYNVYTEWLGGAFQEVDEQQQVDFHGRT